MRITVILCTYNRCRSLADSLESIAGQQLYPKVEWEVLVVDNNSTDQTRSAVEGFCSKYPGRFRYVFEGQPGKSYALNAGIRAAQGDIIAFMDDDVTVEPTWLNRLIGPLLDGEWAGVGGRILPVWPFTPPNWLPTESRWDMGPLAIFDRGDVGCQLHEAPFGANMAFKKSMFDQYGGFRTDLGPNPDNMIRDEDSEFGDRLIAAGERLYYEPSAVVLNPVPENRMRKAYIWEWWLGKGRAHIRRCGITSSTGYCYQGIPLYLYRRLGITALRCIVALTPRVRFQRKCSFWYIKGQILECRQLGAKLSAPLAQS